MSLKIIDKTDALANSILFTVRALALLLVVALFAGACSERVQRNFNALTTPAPGTCGTGSTCGDGCCSVNWACRPRPDWHCEFMGLPEWQPTQQYWTVGGAQSPTPETRPPTR